VGEWVSAKGSGRNEVRDVWLYLFSTVRSTRSSLTGYEPDV
jgi:hypothetical protein